MSIPVATTRHTVGQPASPGLPGRLTRLRPVVHATAVPDGLHVRGWTSSFTINGSPDLWRLWQAVTAALADGGTPDSLAARIDNAAVRDAVATLVAQLREHDMLVDLPTTWDTECGDTDVARWLESVAPDPHAAWRRLRAASATVRGGGRLAAAAIRALAASGVAATREDGPPDRLALTAQGLTVIAAADADCGFATPVLETVGRGIGVPDPSGVADAVAARLRLATVRSSADETPVLAALVAGVAAHRLLCEVAGLSDPAVDSPAHDGRPHEHVTALVFVARLDPLRGSYHPWLDPVPAPRPPAGAVTSVAADARLDLALARAETLTDPELGPLPPPRVTDLPQTPAGIAAVGTSVGIGSTVDVARLHAVIGAAEATCRRAPEPHPSAWAVGADPLHAEGVALRRLAHRHFMSGAGLPAHPLPAVAEHEWSCSPVARQWWKSLTLRLGVPAALTVVRLAPNAHHATVTGGGERLGWAVEATAADAAATALVAAVGTAQWAAVTDTGPMIGTEHDLAGSARLRAPCGASPAHALPDPERVPWHTDTWAWPTPLVGHEPQLQATLRRLLGATARRLGTRDGIPAAVESVFAAIEVTR